MRFIIFEKVLSLIFKLLHLMSQTIKASITERVIKIAIANKLLKQAFAIATSKEKYIENYQPNGCF